MVAQFEDDDLDKLKRRLQLARDLGVSERTLDRWVREGLYGLKKLKVGSSVFFDISEFDLTTQCEQSASQIAPGSTVGTHI
jgi:hypothetical protein